VFLQYAGRSVGHPGYTQGTFFSRIRQKVGMSTMSRIEFSKDEKEAIVLKVQRYFRKELDQDIGRFDAEFLTDFFSEEVGAYYYNRGLYDARAVLQAKLDDLDEAIYEIEKPTDSSG